MKSRNQNHINGRYTVKLQAYDDLTVFVPDAKTDACKLLNDSNTVNSNLLYETDLSKIENGIKQLNQLSNKYWLISALALYEILYTKELYKNSGYDWATYMTQAKERLGYNKVEISMQLSSARFFIKHHKRMIELGWKPEGSMSNLAKAELAFELSRDLDAVIKHLISDTTAKFKAWYSSFKIDEKKSWEVSFEENAVLIGNEKVLTFEENLSLERKSAIKGILKDALSSIANGKTPLVVSMENKEEADKMKQVLSKLK